MDSAFCLVSVAMAEDGSKNCDARGASIFAIRRLREYADGRSESTLGGSNSKRSFDGGSLVGELLG